MEQKKSKRIVALDAFRGLTIATMITVNNPGSWEFVYPPLRHAAWNGCTPTDLVFPFFLFIVGVAMFFSFRIYNNELSKPVVIKTIRRTILIFAIGLALNAFPYIIDYSELRIMGVFQRIALAYGVGAILCLWLSPRKLIYTLAAILVGYWALLGLSVPTGAYELETNLVRVVDLAILGENHVYGGFGLPFDPEGFLSTIPAIGTVILGYLTGLLIYKVKEQEKIVLHLFLYGFPLVVVGMIWDAWFPINKALWTSSYVLYTAGLAMVMLAFFIWFIDVKGYTKWSNPLVVFGMNPLFIFVLSGLYVKTLYKIPSEAYGNGYSWLYNTVFVPIGGNMNGSLMFALTHIVLFWLIVLFLYRKKIFIKI